MDSEGPIRDAIARTVEEIQSGRPIPGHAARCSGCGSGSAAWHDLSFLLDDAGRKVEALDAARKAVALAPRSSRLLVNLGTRLLDNGRPYEAIPYLEQAVQIHPEAAPPMGVLGIAHYRAHHYATAAEWLEAALRPASRPRRARLRVGELGVSLDEIGATRARLRGWPRERRRRESRSRASCYCVIRPGWLVDGIVVTRPLVEAGRPEP
jgi:tetratricopeptide (TPR) repeat protein